MISISGLSKKFGSQVVLNAINCEFHDGEIVGMLGVNGAGKTTLMRIIYGLMLADQGDVVIDGVSVSADPVHARQAIGVLPDDGGLYLRLSARENIQYFGRLSGLEDTVIDQRINRLVEKFSMQDFIDRRTEGFSLGQRMKTRLARAIIHEPKHILLDEPTNGLDVLSTRAVREHLRLLKNEGRSVIFSSHLMYEVSGLCDRVIVLHQGQLVASGTVEEVIAKGQAKNLEEAFVNLTNSSAKEFTHGK